MTFFLGLGECNKRHKPFTLTDNKLLAIVKHEIEVKCLVTKEKYPCLGDQVNTPYRKSIPASQLNCTEGVF